MFSLTREKETVSTIEGFENLSRAGEMAQWLRALAALPEDLSSIPSNHMAAHTLCNPEDLTPSHRQGKKTSLDLVTFQDIIPPHTHFWSAN